MFYALDQSNEKIPPTKDVNAVCPCCNTKVIAKCWSVNIHHWAHETADCDPWYEPMSEWHKNWQSLFKPELREVVIGRHRADICINDKLVIELQHSHISALEVAEREQFYNTNHKMIWILDGMTTKIKDNFEISNQWQYKNESYISFRWKYKWKSFEDVKPYIHFQDKIIDRYWDEDDYYGRAQIYTKKQFATHLKSILRKIDPETNYI